MECASFRWLFASTTYRWGVLEHITTCSHCNTTLQYPHPLIVPRFLVCSLTLRTARLHLFSAAVMRDSKALTLPKERLLSYTLLPMPGPAIFTPILIKCRGKEFTRGNGGGGAWSAPDRPGIGNSSFQPNCKLLDGLGDIHVLADHLMLPTCMQSSLAKTGACVSVPIICSLYSQSIGPRGMLFAAPFALCAGP